MEETTSLLQSWGVEEDIIGRFRENGIDIDTFKDLNELLLKELCPHMGQRIKLRNHIQDHLECANADTESCSTKTSASNINQTDMQIDDSPSLPDFSFHDIDKFLHEQNRPPLPEFDIRTLLQTSAHGCSILSYFTKYNILNSKKRNELVDIVVKHIYTYVVNNNLKPEDYNYVAAKIVAVFPSECVNSYYVKAIPKLRSSTGKYIPAKGKLVDKVRNLLYISEAKRRTSRNISQDKENHQETNVYITDPSDDAIWLQNNEEPWEDVVRKWDKTFSERQRTTDSTVHQFLEKWQILKNQKGHLLINQDFEKLYNEKTLNFFKEWETFFQKVLNIKKKDVTNANAILLMETLDSLTDNDKKIPLQVTLLGYLVPPKGRLTKKIKFSSSEAIEGLIVLTHNAGDIDAAVEAQKKKATSRNTTVQPYVLLLGSLLDQQAVYIVIDDIKYRMQSAAKAFDTLFKIYHVCNAQYPKAASHLYTLIQIKVYGIVTKYDNVPPHILDILKL